MRDAEDACDVVIRQPTRDHGDTARRDVRGGRTAPHVAERAVAAEDAVERVADALGHVTGTEASRGSVLAAGEELTALLRRRGAGGEGVDRARLPEEVLDRLAGNVDQHRRG